MVPSSIGFIGAGNMAEALIRGLLETRTCPAEKIFIADVNDGRLAAMHQTYGVQTRTDNPSLAHACPVLILAVKPQQAPAAIASLKPAMEPERHVLFSIVAGLSTAYLEKTFGLPLRVVRVMPNTPARLRAGASAICPGRYARGEELALAQTLFSAVGLVLPVEESLMNAVTALSGSGPAYVFRLCELMISAGVDMGLTPEDAEKLSVQTILGAARMLAESGQSPAELRGAVTSAGGTTEAALKHLDASEFSVIFKTALKRARDRAQELTPAGPEALGRG